MPFRMTISDVEYADSEIHIAGKIVEGGYSGPEWVIFADQSGQQRSAWVTHHVLHHPKGWPVEPSHNAVLILSIGLPSLGVKIDETKPLIGCGAVSVNNNRLDITAELGDPRFWALELSTCLVSKEISEPYAHFFGISSQDLVDYSQPLFEDPFHHGVWPYVRQGVGDANYVELEFTEVQERFWIGNTSSERRVLLGYYSGHTSFPAFRIEEVLWFLGEANTFRHNQIASLLCLTACYLSSVPSAIFESIKQLIPSLPGVKLDRVDQMTEVFIENLLVPDGRWEYHHELGWINSWMHSQRNPESSMSALKLSDFRFIEEFFI